MSAHIWAALTWAAVVASAAGWAAVLSRPPAVHAVAAVTAAPTPPPTAGDLQRLLGAGAPLTAAETPAPASPRFRLIGVIAPAANGLDGAGIALITVDDRPARTFRVGATIDDQLVLQAVSARGVRLGRDGDAAPILLDLAPVDAMPSKAAPMLATSPQVASMASLAPMAQPPAGAFGGPPRAQPIQLRGPAAAAPGGQAPGTQTLPGAPAAPATSTVLPTADPPPFGAPPRTR